MNNETLLSVVQGLAAGAIIMAYICNYNRSQLPIAIICLIASVISRTKTE